MALLTYEAIEAGRSKNGGWSKKQLEAIGVTWPPVHGWLNWIVEKRVVVSDERYALFLSLKDAHL